MLASCRMSGSRFGRRPAWVDLLLFRSPGRHCIWQCCPSDLYRRDVIAKLAFRPPSDNDREIELWEAVAKFIVNGGVDSEQEKLLKYKDSSTN
jgi:hypothetical protein